MQTKRFPPAVDSILLRCRRKRRYINDITTYGISCGSENIIKQYNLLEFFKSFKLHSNHIADN